MPNKFSLSTFLLLFTFNASAIEQVITMPTVGKTDHHVRIQAKNKALLASLDKLPSIIWGQETLSNDTLSEHIQTIGYAHADVIVLSESFDRQHHQYTLVADVVFNENKISQALKDVSDGRFAIATLKEINTIMKTVDLQGYIKTGHQLALPSYTEATLFTNPYFYAQSHRDFVSFHERLIDQFAQLQIKQNQAYISQFSVELIKVTKDHFTYRLVGPEIPNTLLLTSAELQRLYNDYADEISMRAGGICLFSPLVNKFFALPDYDEQLELTLQVNQEYARLAYSDLLYKQEMNALEFTYCEGQTKDLALSLNTARPFFIKKAD